MRRILLPVVTLLLSFAMAVPLANSKEKKEFKVGKTYFGFKLLEEKKIPEINATGLVFEHKRSGARLVKFVTDDPNKSFSIAFKTPPEGDYGIPHILEHSVLNGSRKFPVKSPFDVLAKGSLNTFLNAMTSSDFTMYPVASTNTKDFFNLMDVYLDAVFYPRIYKEPRVFKQEGWHYELDKPDGELTYNGVVYNEMKGAYSSPESVLDYQVNKALFPQTPYGLESGGLPSDIPKLQREKLLAFHKKYYHPSNSYISLWGDGNTLDELKFINDNYLNGFKKAKVDSTIPLQKPFKEMKKVRARYPIASKEDPKNKTYLCLAWVAGSATDPVLSMSLDVLSDVLVNRPSSPVRKALERAKIGKDSYAYYDATKQGVFRITATNANESDMDKFKEVVFHTLEDLAEKGLDKKQVEGVINKLEFRLREADYGTFPTGLVYTYFGLRGWMFANDPFLGVAYDAPLDEVRKALNSNMLEDMIKKYLLRNHHGVLIDVVPKPGMEDENAKALKKELAAIKAKMKPDQIKKLVQETKDLKAWQAAPDKPEDLAKIPMLTLKDLDTKEKKYPVNEFQFAGTKVLHFDHATNGIIYVQVMFDSSVVPQEMLPYLGVLAGVLGEMDTENFTYGQLDTQMSIYTGGMDFSPDVFTNVKKPNEYFPKFIVTGKALVPKVGKLMELAEETILRTRLGDKKRLKDVLNKLNARYQGYARSAGISLASTRLMSYLTPSGAYSELLNGLSFVQFMSGLVKNFDENSDNLIADLQFLSSILFRRNNMIVGVTCSKDDLPVLKDPLAKFVESMGNKNLASQKYEFNTTSKNEGLVAASKVQYVVEGADLSKLGYKYSGKMDVLGRILSRDFLTEKIRVQGGAYGAWASFGRTGYAYLGSYRDPHLNKTLQTYSKIVDYLKGFDADARSMTRYIIGVIGSRDKPTSPAAMGRRAITYFLRRISSDDLQKERTEILSTSKTDIQHMAPMLDALLKNSSICVYGNEKKLKENKKLFKSLVNVIN